MWYKIAKRKFDSAIVALWFDESDISKLKISNSDFDVPVKGNEYHVTLFYLGKISDIKDKKKSIDLCAEELSRNFSNFKLEIGGVAKFFPKKESTPIVATVNAQELEDLRQKIVSAMEAIGIQEEEGSPSFMPHMTLGYNNGPYDIESISLKNNKIEVKGVSISWGGDIKTFKFGG